MKVLHRFEPVEWQYDGLNGKIIKWTLEHGNTNHDPSVLAFVVGVDGSVEASLQTGAQYQPGSFAKWAAEAADKYERAHPRTRMPFVRAAVSVEGQGTERKALCAELEGARGEGKPVLLYFGRDRFDPADRAGKKENRLARKFEKAVLSSKDASKAAAGWTLLRFDLADEDHALFAASLGVTAAPTVLLLAVGSEEPENLGSVSGYALTRKLKQNAPKLAGEDEGAK